MASVSARFVVQSVTDHQGGSSQVRLAPLHDPHGANASWSKATPAGSLEMTITNPDALPLFRRALASGDVLALTIAEIPSTLDA